MTGVELEVITEGNAEVIADMDMEGLPFNKRAVFSNLDTGKSETAA